MRIVFGSLIEKISIGIYDTENLVVCGGDLIFLMIFLKGKTGKMMFFYYNIPQKL